MLSEPLRSIPIWHLSVADMRTTLHPATLPHTHSCTPSCSFSKNTTVQISPHSLTSANSDASHIQPKDLSPLQEVRNHTVCVQILVGKHGLPVMAYL
jgi:hypothetical protein